MEKDDAICEAILDAVNYLEENDYIVVCVENKNEIVKKIYEHIIEVMPRENISAEELSAIGRLIYHAISDKSFFDWEIPSLTGMTKEDFERIINKLPKI